MENRTTLKSVCLYGFIIISLLGNSIAISQGQGSDKSNLENELEKATEELTHAAKNVTMKKLKNVEDLLSKGGWDIDTDDWAIISVDNQVREDIAEIQKNIKNLFLATAKKLEEKDEIEIRVDDSGIGLSKGQNEKIKRLSESKEKTNITIGSQAMAIKVLLKINEDLISLAKAEKDRKKKKHMYLTQAIFVYELSSITIDMIDHLKKHGIEDLRTLYKEEMEDMAKMENEFNKMVEEDDDQQAKNWLEALDAIREEWNMLLGFLNKQENWIKNIKESKQKFEKITKKAVLQISLLEKGIIAEKVMDQITAVKSVLEIEDIPLLRLGGEEAISLFTITPSGKDFKDNSIKLITQ